MFIVLVYWKIKSDKETEFLAFWEKRLRIKDKSKLILEYLSKVKEPVGEEDRELFNWKLNREEMLAYVNVGIWRSKEDFVKETKRYRSDEYEFKIEMDSLKADKTERAWLAPLIGRKGQYVLGPEEVKIVD